MVAEKTAKLQCYPFYKNHRGAIPYILCENEISINRLFSKQKGQPTQIWNVYALVGVCVACISLDVIGC